MDAISPIMQGGLPAQDVALYDDPRSEQAFKDLEALFLYELVKEMRKTIPEDEGIFGKNNASTTYQEMLDETYSKAMAESGQFGLAKQLAEQVRMQEARGAVRPVRESAG